MVVVVVRGRGASVVWDKTTPTLAVLRARWLSCGGHGDLLPLLLLLLRLLHRHLTHGLGHGVHLRHGAKLSLGATRNHFTASDARYTHAHTREGNPRAGKKALRCGEEGGAGRVGGE